MPGNPREIVTMAERRFPVRIRIGVPPSGFGQRYMEITEWLDGNCGADGWAITPSGMASAFVARWCAVTKVKTEAGCSGFVTTNRRRGSGRRCTGRFKSQRNPRRIAAAILPGASNMKCCCVRERRPARICERVNWWQSSSSRAPIGGHLDVSSRRRCVAGHPTASLTQLIAAAIAGVLSLCSPASNG